MSGLANLSNSHSLEVALPQETDVAPPLATESNRADAALLRRIDLTTLRLFLAICEERNLTRAAAREGIAASAVSKRMNDFELACGVTLFTRMSKGMALTAAGEALLHHARVTLLNVEKIAAELGEYARGIRGHVRMLANLSAIVQFLPEDLSRFFDAHGPAAHRPAGAAERAGGAGDRGGRRRDRHLLERDRDARLRDVSLSLRQSGHGDAHGSSARRVRRFSFAETLDYDHVGLHASSSIYLRSQYAAAQAGKSIRLRIHVPGFDAVCRMVQANMGVGMMPDRAFDVVGAAWACDRFRSATNGRGGNSRSSCAIRARCRARGVLSWTICGKRKARPPA